MRILHFSPRYAPATGGAEIHLAQFSERLAADGHEVTVATTDALSFEGFWDPRHSAIAETESTVNGVSVRRFPVRHFPMPSVSYRALRRLTWLLSGLPGLSGLAATLARFAPWSPQLAQWAASTAESFDLVAGMNIAYEGLVAIGQSLARRQGIPFIVYPLTHLGAGPRPGQDSVSRFYTMRHQNALVWASRAIIAQTAAESDYYLGQGVAADRLHVVGPGITPAEVLGGQPERARQKYGLSGPIVFSLGALSYDKGMVHLIETMQEIWQAGRPVHLVLAGTMLEPFEQYLARLPLAAYPFLHVLENISDADKGDLFAAAYLYAMPSRTDSFGITYLEAWLYAKPVIGAQAWGIGDVIKDGEDGLLVPFGDPAALATAITRLLDDPELALQLGRQGALKAQDHTWDQKYAQISQIYHEAVQ